MAIEECRAALLTFADIKAAVEDFNRGESNLFEALEQIRVALSMKDKDSPANSTSENMSTGSSELMVGW